MSSLRMSSLPGGAVLGSPTSYHQAITPMRILDTRTNAASDNHSILMRDVHSRGAAVGIRR